MKDTDTLCIICERSSQKFAWNITHIQHGDHLSHIQYPSNIQAPSFYAAACQCQLLQYQLDFSFTVNHQLSHHEPTRECEVLVMVY
jgi:hypothetical protein